MSAIARQPRIGERHPQLVNLVAVTLGLAAACAVFESIDEAFFSSFNLNTLALFSSIAVLVGIGQLMVLAIGQFNLAIGAMGASGGVTAAALMQVFRVPITLAILAGLVAGLIAGLAQGLLIAYTPLNPFIVTLALASVYLGAATGMTGAVAFNTLPGGFDNIGTVLWFSVTDEWWIVLAIAVFVWFLFHGTAAGPRLLATGGDRNAAFASGVQVKSLTVAAHAASGVLGAAAGILLAAQLGSAQISIGGDWLLISFAGPVLGGTSISGGRVSVVGAILGGCLMTVLQNGLVIAGASPYWVDSFYGVALVFAFAVDRLRRHHELQIGAA